MKLMFILNQRYDFWIVEIEHLDEFYEIWERLFDESDKIEFDLHSLDVTEIPDDIPKNVWGCGNFAT